MKLQREPVSKCSEGVLIEVTTTTVGSFWRKEGSNVRQREKERGRGRHQRVSIKLESETILTYSEGVLVEVTMHDSGLQHWL